MYPSLLLIAAAFLYCLWRSLLRWVDEDIQARWNDEAPHRARTFKGQMIRAEVRTSAELRLT